MGDISTSLYIRSSDLVNPHRSAARTLGLSVILSNLRSAVRSTSIPSGGGTRVEKPRGQCVLGVTHEAVLLLPFEQPIKKAREDGVEARKEQNSTTLIDLPFAKRAFAIDEEQDLRSSA